MYSFMYTFAEDKPLWTQMTITIPASVSCKISMVCLTVGTLPTSCYHTEKHFLKF